MTVGLPSYSTARSLWNFSSSAIPSCWQTPCNPANGEPNRWEDAAVDLSLWIPLTLGLGLMTLLLMYAFAEACARI